MYEIFERLLRENGVKASDVSKATGIRASTLSDWKRGKYAPKMDKMQKIADYFGVPIEYLLGESDYRLDEETVKSDEEAFSSYLNSLGWKVSPLDQSAECYTISNGAFTVNVFAEKYKAFERRIRNECVDEVLKYVAEALQEKYPDNFKILPTAARQRTDFSEEDK